MKNVLLVAPDHVGIIKAMLEVLRANKEYTIDYIDLVLAPEEKFQYKNQSQRIRNFFLKTFTKNNLKEIYYRNTIIDKIKRSKAQYDAILFIRPDLLNDEALQLLRNRTGQAVAYYWDTVKFYPRKLAIRPYFDRIFSFDLSDCRSYGFEELTNCYFFTEIPGERKEEVYGIITLDQRKAALEKLGAAFEKEGVTYCLKAVDKHTFQSKYVQSVTRMLVYKDMLKEMSFANVLVEVQKPGQHGLSLRPFEALGMKKKLITTNAMVKEYDFYSPENICVVDPDNIHIPAGFFSNPYKELDPKLMEKYHISTWFNTLVSPVPSNFAVK